jgi:SAM-dependent methyltransferase
VAEIDKRHAVTAAAYDAMSARYAEFVQGELSEPPLDREVLAAFAEHVRRPRLRFQTGSMHALPFGDGALAGIVSWYSLIHAAPGDVPGYFAEFRRVLRPGGYVLAAFFEAADEPVTAFEHKVTPAYRWPLGELAALAAEAGFAEAAACHASPARVSASAAATC